MKKEELVRRISKTCFFVIFAVFILFNKTCMSAETNNDTLSSIKVTLNYRDADLVDVIRSISEESKINIVAGPNVKGKVTTHLNDVTLREALNTILVSNGYTYIKQDNIFLVIPASSQAEAQGAVTEQAVVKVFELKCVSAEDVKSAIAQLLTKNGIIQIFTRSKEGGGKGRSNFLIISDIPSIVGSISEIIKSLDVNPPQVIIEARLVDVSLDTADKIGVKWNVNGTLAGSSVPVTFPIDRKGHLIPSDYRTSGSLPTAIAGSTSSTTSTVGTSFTQGNFFPDVIATNFAFGKLDFTNLSATLDLFESEGRVKTIAAPKIAALDNEEAEISIAQDIPIPLYQLNRDTGSLVVTGYQIQKVGIILKVTPHVIEKDLIMMRLWPQVSSLTGQFVGPNNERPITSSRQAQTVVTVKDGETIAIGGLINEQETVTETKVPFLNKIPFLGGMFKHKNKTFTKKNLMIFVTPHIVRGDAADSALKEAKNLNKVDNKNKIEREKHEEIISKMMDSALSELSKENKAKAAKQNSEGK